LVLDAVKGAVAVVVASWVLDLQLWESYIAPHVATFANGGMSLQQVYWCITGAAVAAIIGHMFPVWLSFRGGKGVATGVGVFLVLAPGAVAIVGLIFMLIVVMTRYVSLGSIFAAASLPLIIWVLNIISPRFAFAPVITAATVVALLIIFAHRANVGRLVQGTESKFR